MNSPPHVEEQEVYNYYTEILLPAFLSSLPVLLSRLAHDAYSHLCNFTTAFIQFLFPIWFRQWTAETTDTIARAAKDVASEGGELLSHIWSSDADGNNSTFIDYIMGKMDRNNDGKFSAVEWSSNAEEMKREVELLIHQYYHAVTDRLQKQQHATWYSWLRSTISAVISVDWSLGAYLWHTCSGLIIVLVITSILPGRLHGWTGRVLRFPILGMTYMMISVELAIYTMIRFAIRALEVVFANRRHRAWRKSMEQAKTYEQWYEIAQRLDDSQGREEWRNKVDDDTAYRYSWPFILELLSDLKSSRKNNDVNKALVILQQCTRKNVGGIMSDDLFSFTNTGEPKRVVSEFIDEVERTLLWATEEVRKNYPLPALLGVDNFDECFAGQRLKSKIDEEQSKLIQHVISWATLGVLGNKSADNKRETDQNSKDSKMKGIGSNPTKITEQRDMKDTTSDDYVKSLLMREKVKTFLKRARAAYGRTALCLSGGAMMGNYHFGAVKALLENDLLPPIISGTSAGAVIGAMICTRTKEELLRDMTPEVLAPNMSIFASSWGERWARWYRHGTMFDQEDWYRRVKFFTCGDLTFEEAYQKTGRIFCVTLSATSKKAPPVLINYITAPNVVIASAVVASAAVPGFVDAMKLKVKDENGVVRDQATRGETYRDGSIDSDIPTTGLAEMLNCRFFLAAQANPHIVPFFYNSKGDVGRPSRWSGGQRDASWRGGYLLSALEMYLKNDMRSKFHFLNDLEVAVGFTSTMMTQTYSGSTTIVPQVCFRDYLMLFEDQSIDDMKRYFQGGSVAAYQHIAMLKLHYKIAHTLDECLARLEYDESPNDPPRRRLSQLYKQKSLLSMTAGEGLLFRKLDQPDPSKNCLAYSNSVISDGYISGDEHEKGGFDGVECSFGPKK